jgi:hypothetical protein
MRKGNEMGRIYSTHGDMRSTVDDKMKTDGELGSEDVKWLQLAQDIEPRGSRSTENSLTI